MYEYNATVHRVIDADTFVLDIDLGMNIRIRSTCRLKGADAPEFRSPEGLAARRWVEQWFESNAPLLIKTYKDKTGKYGRLLVDVSGVKRESRPDCDWFEVVDLAKDLIEAGHAEEYK